MKKINRIHAVVSQLAENNNISYADAKEIYIDAKKVNAAPIKQPTPKKLPASKKQAAPKKAAIAKSKKK